VGVRFDKSGHQDSATAINHTGAVPRYTSVSTRDLGYTVAVDSHLRVEGFAAAAIEHTHVTEYDVTFWGCFHGNGPSLI
jgi:hypothetical protein